MPQNLLTYKTFELFPLLNNYVAELYLIDIQFGEKIILYFQTYFEGVFSSIWPSSKILINPLAKKLAEKMLFSYTCKCIFCQRFHRVNFTFADKTIWSLSPNSFVDGLYFCQIKNCAFLFQDLLQTHGDFQQRILHAKYKKLTAFYFGVNQLDVTRYISKIY